MLALHSRHALRLGALRRAVVGLARRLLVAEMEAIFRWAVMLALGRLIGTFNNDLKCKSTSLLNLLNFRCFNYALVVFFIGSTLIGFW